MNYITSNGCIVDEKAFLDEWKDFYKKHTADSSIFKTERDIFISRIQMFYDRYGISRNAENDADSLLSGAFERETYTETKAVLSELMKKYNVKRCYYGHLHGASIADAVEGVIEGIEFKLVSADGLNFNLLKI